MAEKCHSKKKLTFFFGQSFFIVTRREGKRKRRRSNMKKILKTTLFEHILKKTAHPLFGAWSLLLVHVWFTPSQGFKGFKNAFSRNEIMEVFPWIVTLGKMPFDMGQLHGPWSKQPLSLKPKRRHIAKTTISLVCAFLTWTLTPNPSTL